MFFRFIAITVLFFSTQFQNIALANEVEKVSTFKFTSEIEYSSVKGESTIYTSKYSLNDRVTFNSSYKAPTDKGDNFIYHPQKTHKDVKIFGIEFNVVYDLNLDANIEIYSDETRYEVGIKFDI